jgi:hypothetical protein
MAEGLYRDDHGHFQGSSEAFRHWDEEGEVPGSCSRCHSAEGLPLFVTEGVEISQHISNGFQCETCHGGEEWPARYPVSSVTFPSGAEVAVAEGDDAGLCMSCHQGRESSVSVDARIGTVPANTVSADLGFINVHYFPAGASRYGSEAQGGYQFAGKTYAGYFEHVDGFASCIDCHDAHELEVKTENCFTCHAGVEDVKDIRKSEVDFDGDGDTTEGLYGEVIPCAIRCMLPCKPILPALLELTVLYMMPTPTRISSPMLVRDLRPGRRICFGLPTTINTPKRIQAHLRTTVPTSSSF